MMYSNYRESATKVVLTSHDAVIIGSPSWEDQVDRYYSLPDIEQKVKDWAANLSKVLV